MTELTQFFIIVNRQVEKAFEHLDGEHADQFTQLLIDRFSLKLTDELWSEVSDLVDEQVKERLREIITDEKKGGIFIDSKRLLWYEEAVLSAATELVGRLVKDYPPDGTGFMITALKLFLTVIFERECHWTEDENDMDDSSKNHFVLEKWDK